MLRGVALIIIVLIVLFFVFKPVNHKEKATVVAPGVFNRDEAKVTLRPTSGATDEIKRDIRFGAS